MGRAWVKREKLPDSANEKLNVKIDNLRKMHQYEEKDIFLRKIGIL